MNSIWKLICSLSILSYIVFEYIVINDPHFVKHCNYHLDPRYDKYNYICFGAFCFIFCSLSAKMFMLKYDIRFVPLYTALVILLISTITPLLSILYKNVYCIDILNVGSNPYLWGEMISCSPLLVYSTFIVSVDKVDTTKLIIILCEPLCIILGFFILIAQSKIEAYVILASSFATYSTIFFLPYTIKETKVLATAANTSAAGITNQENFYNEKKKIQYNLSIVLCIMLSVFPFVYVLGMFNIITPESTVVLFNIMCIICKGIYTHICYDSYPFLITKFEDDLIKEQQANEVRRNFVKYIFHEIRTPFNTISIALDLFENNVENGEEYLHMMRDSCDNITETLNSVLTMQKIEEGRLELNYNYYNIKKIFQKIYNLLRPNILQKKINIFLLFSQNTPELIYVDGLKIEHVILNLLGNAIKFTPQKGNVSIVVLFERFYRDDPSKTEFSLLLRGRDVDNSREISVLRKPATTGADVSSQSKIEKCFTTDDNFFMKVFISDDGPGINKADIKRLFNPYSQIRADKMQEGKGTGLGLYFCKNVVELHNGYIDVKSVEGKQTTFNFCIPITKYKHYDFFTRNDSFEDNFPSITLPPKITDGGASGAASPETCVLIVDDFKLSRKLLKDMLMIYSIKSNEAENGKDALWEVQKNNYKVIFMDCNMPEMDGIEAIRELRAGGFDNIILGLTGFFKDEMDAMMLAGANYVFSKPISKENIEKVLKFIKDHSCNIGTKRLDFHRENACIAEDELSCKINDI